jgi:hypothetical protein
MAQGRKTGGRQKGTPNKTTAQLKDMILTALDQAHPKGGIAYLKQQAGENPTAFLSLVGKVLPLTLTGDKDSPLKIEIVRFGNSPTG